MSFVLVRLKGFEPPTFWFVAKHSIQLSYRRIHFLMLKYYNTSKRKNQVFFMYFAYNFGKTVRQCYFSMLAR